jgi:RTX calcium-binding nonapeptide repeat (4 copies)
VGQVLTEQTLVTHCQREVVRRRGVRCFPLAMGDPVSRSGAVGVPPPTIPAPDQPHLHALLFIFGGSENDTLVGSSGGDELRGEGGADTLWGDESTVSTNFQDTLYGGSENDLLTGDSPGSYGAGYGYAMDTLLGEAGDDTRNGDGGDGYGADLADLLEGGPGLDSLRGEGGDDVYDFNGSSQLDTDTVNDISSSLGDLLDFSDLVGAINVDIALSSNQLVSSILRLILLSASTTIEKVKGTSSSDSIYGNNLANTLEGNAGNDLIQGRQGNALSLQKPARPEITYAPHWNRTCFRKLERSNDWRQAACSKQCRSTPPNRSVQATSHVAEFGTGSAGVVSGRLPMAWCGRSVL